MLARNTYWRTLLVMAFLLSAGRLIAQVGYRNHNGQFSHIRNIATWWSVSPTADSTSAWSLSLGYGNGVVSRSYEGVQAGLAIRCLRD